MKSQHDQIAGWCLHFTGLMAKACKAGVVYDSLNGPPWPCLRDVTDPAKCAATEANTICSKREWPTEEYIAERIEASNKAAAEFLRRMAENLCVECEASINRKVQVGRCVYAEPCGHRQYQGRVA